MTSRTATNPCAVRPRSRQAECENATASIADPVVTDESSKDWILIRVPKVSVGRTAAATKPTPVAMSAAAVEADAQSMAEVSDKPVKWATEVAPPATVQTPEEKPAKKHFRIDAAHVATPAPHVAAEGWTQRQAKWMETVGGWKTLTAAGLIVAVLVGALAARSARNSAKNDSADDKVAASEKSERQLERERRLARRRASAAGNEPVTVELSKGPSENLPVKGGESPVAANTATTASWNFEAAANTPASLSGRHGRATAVNLNVERTDRAARRGSVMETGPTLPHTIGEPVRESTSRIPPGDYSTGSAPQPQYRMAELPSYRSASPAAPGTVQLRGSIDHAPLHTAP